MSSPDVVVDHLMRKFPYHENGHKDVQFAIAVQCFAHYGAIASIWVYIGCLTPHQSKKKKKGDKGADD